MSEFALVMGDKFGTTYRFAATPGVAKQRMRIKHKFASTWNVHHTYQ